MNSPAAPQEFDGKRALVTGGTKGIGQAVVARLREGGATVFTTARERPDDLPDTNLFMATDITPPKVARPWFTPRRLDHWYGICHRWRHRAHRLMDCRTDWAKSRANGIKDGDSG
jgi:hypothetical protein